MRNETSPMVNEPFTLPDFALEREHLPPIMSSTTIDGLRNRSRRGWLCAGVVNLNDQTEHLSR